ncbi:MAG TPA: FixH family protein [Roseiflexaceae bacterium]|nr:FixH family protein [Roseiflexaceae bacterium]
MLNSMGNRRQETGDGRQAATPGTRHSSRVARHASLGTLAYWWLLALLLCTLAACGGSGITQTTQTERYNVEMTLDSASFGERTATIRLNDRSGQPATVDQVVLAPVMISMGMASPELTAQPSGPGRYQAKGEFFSMLGEWQVSVRVSAGGKDDTARFMFQVEQ